MDDFEVVVGKTDGAIGKGSEYGDPDKAVAKIRPQQGWYEHGDYDEDSAHGRGASLALMSLWAIFANVLANLKVAEAADYCGADDQPDD